MNITAYDLSVLPVQQTYSLASMPCYCASCGFKLTFAEIQDESLYCYDCADIEHTTYWSEDDENF